MSKITDVNPEPPGGKRRRTARSVLVIDRVARGGITLGGVGIIIAILGILIFILFEAIPLFRAGEIEPTARFRLTPPADAIIDGSESTTARGSGPEWARRFHWREPMAIGIDEYREVAWRVADAPQVDLFDPRDGRLERSQPLDSLVGARITASAVEVGGGTALATSDGRILVATAEYGTAWENGQRESRVDWREESVIRLPQPGAIVHLARRGDVDGVILACTQVQADGGESFFLIRQTIERNLMDEETRTTRRDELSSEIPEAVTALTLRKDELFAGTVTGRVYRFRFVTKEQPRLEEVLEVEPGSAVTALRWLLGEVTLLAGTETGGVTTWFGVREENLGNRLRPFRRIREFPPLAGAIVDFAPSPRNKSFAVLDAAGDLRVLHQTTGRTLVATRMGEVMPESNAAGGAAPGTDAARAATVGFRTIAFAPKGDGLIAAAGSGEIDHRTVRIPHPEISLRALFDKVWYEGYSRPEYVWQSTGGSDDFEGKFSLVPLIFGTLKGTLYALLFAVPIALMAAIYTSQFMADSVRQYVKPTVEIMAALPSVVLGFLAGLFLAPNLERMVPATFVFLVLFPLTPALLGIGWQALPGRIRGRLPLGFELIVLLPAVVGIFFLSRWLGPWAERLLFDGNFRGWLLESAGTRYDQRNCIVVGFAMGFAVIPIIFTIVEDSLTAVPRSLIAGSMACGASRWQTAVRIILPAAGSGIFSAIMIGFGRAVGETMIVLMATGNTPIMDWSIFNGMRTLSANIAVEMPEAPYHGTLYRLLFLAGLLLLLLTSLINTGAELIRLRLKRKFGNY